MREGEEEGNNVSYYTKIIEKTFLNIKINIFYLFIGILNKNVLMSINKVNS